MPIFFDADILSFAWGAGNIFFGRKQRAVEAQREIPVELQFQEIPEDSLTQAQRSYIAPIEKQLIALNYHLDCTYKVTNLKNFDQNMVRRYSNPSDSAACALTIVELKVNVKGAEAVKTSSHVAFRTRFSDGTTLTTRNMSLKSLFDQPPSNIVQECRQISSIAELKNKHDLRASQLGPALPPPSGAAAIFEEAQRGHRQFAEFQVQRGLYQLLPSGQAYQASDKARLRGIWNHHNPFARRVAWPQLFFSALVGSALPLLAILKIVPMLSLPLPVALQLSAPLLVIAIFYALAGLVIGVVCDWAPYYWIMLISYIPAHALAGWSFGWFPFSTLMFIVSFWVIRAKRRRSLIFNSTTAPA